MTRFDQMVDARLGEIREVVRAGVTERVGRVKRDPVTGDAIGRMGGGLTKAYPEIGRAGLTPGRAADAIERGKGKPFLRLRKSVEREIEKFHERPKARRPEKPTVPPHDALSKKCKRCHEYHGKSAHRFHGPGAYHSTHLFAFSKNPPMTREKAKVIFATHMQAARQRKLTRYELDQLARARQALRQSRRPVMNPRRAKRKNPPGQITRIYGRVLRIEAQKTGKHQCDAACKRCGHRYYHDFRRKPSMYGLPDGSILIKE